MQDILNLFLWVHPAQTLSFLLCLLAFIVIIPAFLEELSPHLALFWVACIACVPLGIWMYGFFTLNEAWSQAGRQMAIEVFLTLALIFAPTIIIRQLWIWVKNGFRTVHHIMRRRQHT